VPDVLVVSETEQIVQHDTLVELVDVPTTELLTEQGPGEVLEVAGETQLLQTIETAPEYLERGSRELIEVAAQGPAGPPGPPGGGGAATLQLIAQGALSGHRVVRATALGVAYVDPSDPQQAGTALGVTTHAALNQQPVLVQQIGELEESTWAWTLNLPVYVGANGVLTQAPPTAGFVEIVGMPTAPTKLAINLRNSIILEN
jgi:hypothetical protein